jgi:hypothetical protein
MERGFSRAKDSKPTVLGDLFPFPRDSGDPRSPDHWITRFLSPWCINLITLPVLVTRVETC